MRNVAAAAVCGAMLVALACGIAYTAPKPSDIPTSWQLDFTIDKAPRPIRLEVPGQKGMATFWYLEYTVTNKTDDEQLFVPEFVLYADTGQILRAGQGVPGMVFLEIKKQLNDPLLLDQADISARPLLRGANNARQGVMIFQDIDEKAGAFDIFVGGLSGETLAIFPPNPVPKVVYDKDNKKQVVMVDKIVLRKTLQLHYALPGAASARNTTPVQLQQKTWIMR
jgi:hypothetical protein